MFQADLTLTQLKSNPFASLFLLWWIFLPFGASIWSIDLGPIVIYPHLIISVAIGFWGLKSLIQWNKMQYFYLVFVLLWLIQGSVQYFNNTRTDLALFDLRSLIYQVITTGILFSTYTILKKELFFSIVIYGIRFYVMTLLLVGVVESFTGIHLVGTTTQKLLELQVGNLHYAPIFVYDNPNDFIAHGLFFITILFILDKKWGRNSYLMITCFLVMYYFAELADSRFGKMGALAVILFLAIFEFVKLKKLSVWLWACCLLLVVIFAVSNSFQLGPKYQDGEKYRINEMVDISLENGQVDVQPLQSKYSEAEQKRIILAMDSIIRTNPNQSTNIRQALIANSFAFIKEQPFFGIGPGQYYQRHMDGKVENFTGTVTSAHCFPMEVISVYGLMGMTYLLILSVVFVKILLLKSLRYENFLRILLAVCVIVLVWMMPSSYVYLEIHRLTLPLLLLLFISLKKNSVNE